MGSVEVRRGRQPTRVVYQTGYPCRQLGSLAEALWETTQHTPHTHPTRGVREQGWGCGHTSFHQSQAQGLSAASGECSFPGTSNLTRRERQCRFQKPEKVAGREVQV